MITEVSIVGATACEWWLRRGLKRLLREDDVLRGGWLTLLRKGFKGLCIDV